MDQWEVTYQNHKSGRVGVCTLDEWNTLNNHPKLRGANKLIKKVQIITPQAAIEAQEAKIKSESKTVKKKSLKATPETKANSEDKALIVKSETKRK